MPHVKHLVLFKFKPSTPRDKIGEIFEALDELPATIPGLIDFVGGAYRSPEGLNQGFTHGFVMTFADPESRDVYIDHPEHEKIVQVILPELDGGLSGAIAFDFEVNDRFRY
jgi:hypothetical protein